LRSLPKALTQCRHQGTSTVKNAPAFAFDWMERERPKIDRAVLDSSRGTFSIPRILSFALTAFAG
jgi:hypothetical protein